jgi:hypothetical protein
MTKRRSRQESPDGASIEALELELERLPLESRVAAVADDLESGERRFEAIDPRRLVELLGEEPNGNGCDPSFQTLAERLNLDQVMECSDGLYDILDAEPHLREALPEARVESLLASCASAGIDTDAWTQVLTGEEKQALADAYMQHECMEGCAGLTFVDFNVKGGGREVWFCGLVECDGEVITLNGPYQSGLPGVDWEDWFETDSW